MEAGQNGGGDAASQLAGIQQALVTAGFSSAEDLISAHQKECADHKAAAEARDKFSEHNAKAQVIIRTKGGDIGQLKQQIADLEAEITDLKTKAEETPGAPAAPAAPTPPGDPQPQPSSEEELKALEASLTDAHWLAADELMKAMADEEVEQYTTGGKLRLEFLRGLKSDPALRKQLPRPTTLRPGAVAPNAPAAPKESVYDALLARVGKAPRGPGGPAGVVVRGTQGAQPTRPVADWVKN